MTQTEERGGRLLTGTLASDGAWPLNVRAVLCDLRPRFLSKKCTGPGYRWISRNGRVLLCGDRPLDELTGRKVRVRLQTWHRAILPGDQPEAYGLLFCVRILGNESPGDRDEATFATRLIAPGQFSGELGLDVGGELVLDFRRDSLAC
jgi:hypothetical protein